MSAKVGLYSRPEATPLVAVVADGVRALGLHPIFRNPHPFDRNQVEDFAWIVVFNTHQKSEEISREYLARGIPVILAIPSMDGTATVMSLSKKDGNRPAQEWPVREIKTGLPFRQCSNYPLPGLMAMPTTITVLDDEDLEQMGMEPVVEPEPAAPLPADKPVGRRGRKKEVVR